MQEDNNGTTGTAVDAVVRKIKEEQAAFFQQQEEAFKQRNKEADQQKKELMDMMAKMQTC